MSIKVVINWRPNSVINSEVLESKASDLEYRRWKLTRFDKQTRESVQFYVIARSFDEAIAKARKFYPDCCTGQVSR